MPAYEMPVADSPYTAPGYRILGDDFYTCVKPADCPDDPGVTRAIRMFWPDAIPIWRKQRYLPPGERSTEIVATHHGIATYVAHPKSSRRLFHVEMPANAKHPQPNQLECIFERPNLAEMGGPGEFLPWNNQVLLCVRGNYRSDMVSSAEVFEKMAARQRAQYDRAKKSADEDFAYRRRTMEKRIQKTLETLTERDFREYQEQCKAPYVAKPIIFMGGR